MKPAKLKNKEKKTGPVPIVQGNTTRNEGIERKEFAAAEVKTVYVGALKEQLQSKKPLNFSSFYKLIVLCASP